MAIDTKKEIKDKTQIKEPKKYKVLLLNDNYSTMEFVVEVLVKIFRKTSQEAYELMLKIHNSGSAICGIYTKEIALTKVAQVKINARKAGFPLKAIIQEE